MDHAAPAARTSFLPGARPWVCSNDAVTERTASVIPSRHRANHAA
ncbi:MULTISPECIES: hypothetical protein [unclassified Streptomyces]|nr:MULTISPECIES: hypothetical protein [unclassified Streptomyces]